MNCLELVLAVPKPHRMNVLLKEHEREKGHEEDEDESFRTVSAGDRSYITYSQPRLRYYYFPKRSRNGLLLKMLR
jgi:hypothetical protein